MDQEGALTPKAWVQGTEFKALLPRANWENLKAYGLGRCTFIVLLFAFNEIMTEFNLIKRRNNGLLDPTEKDKERRRNFCDV